MFIFGVFLYLFCSLDTCGAVELVRVVLKDEETRRRQGPLGLPQQTAAQQPVQRGSKH